MPPPHVSPGVCGAHGAEIRPVHQSSPWEAVNEEERMKET